MSFLRWTPFAITALLVATACVAKGIPVDPERDVAIQKILAQFWGNARDVHGNPIQPDSAQDRTTVPVSRTAAYRSLEAGNISGLAEWCGLDWESHYLSLTKAARSMKMIDKQIAFVSVLHGAGQGAFLNSVHGRTCTDYNRTRAKALVLESQESGLPADAIRPWRSVDGA